MLNLIANEVAETFDSKRIQGRGLAAADRELGIGEGMRTKNGGKTKIDIRYAVCINEVIARFERF
jgi:hypothetical protein